MRQPACSPGSRIRYRANIKQANEKDKEVNTVNSIIPETPRLQGVLRQSGSQLRVVELFAGAGGMGLGFLMAGNQDYGFRIIQSAEIQPIYLKSLEKNYKYFANNFTDRIDGYCHSDYTPIDLTESCGRSLVKEAVEKAGGVDILIGGTPCQGFSQSNRSSWNPKSKYNKLVDVFIECAVELSPKVILLENVQGILWTPKNSGIKKNSLTVVDHISNKLTDEGYKLLCF